jgi:glycosyltransferase involved in cell wall biosynthesis
MRVLFVTNLWPSAARPWYGTFVKTQADSLRALGVEIDVLPIRGDETRAAYLSAAIEMARGRAGRGYDVIHAHYGHSGVVARLQLRAPLVLSYCGDDVLGTRTETGSLTVRSRIEAAVFRQLARSCAATITKSAQMEGRLPASCRSRNHIIPSGVDLDRFKPVPRADARRTLGWSDDPVVVLFAADPAVAAKNFPLAQAAADRARADLPELELRVVAGVAPTEMPTVMSAADALLLTSRSEGSPNVVKEAMAAELPVVATRVGDVPERLDGVAGCFAGPADPARLGEALVTTLRRGRSPEARAAVAEVSVVNVARQILAVYEHVSSRAGSPLATASGVA